MKWRKTRTAGMMKPIVANIMITITSSRDNFAIIDSLDVPNNLDKGLTPTYELRLHTAPLTLRQDIYTQLLP